MKFKSHLLVIVLGLSILPFAASCADKKKVIILDGCEDSEALFDLGVHVEKAAPFLIEHGIDTVYNDSSTDCGFILQMGSREKRIKGVITDVDLVDECKEFFRLN